MQTEDAFVPRMCSSMALWAVVMFALGFAPYADAQRIIITPSVPATVQAGGTVHFRANRSVVWSVAPGSRGSIDPDGTYHAPEHITVKQSFAGCQMLPNNHIFNVRVDDLPVHPKSASWIAAAGTGTVNYLPSFPMNILSSETPLQNMTFAYTPRNSGPFRIPQYPQAKIESGWFSPPFTGADRHLLAIDPESCDLQEMYNLYPEGTNVVNQCPKCTSQSGTRYSSLTFGLPINGATDAASMYLTPLTLHFQEIETAFENHGAIEHALRFTLPNPAQSFTWPALSSASYGVGERMPMGSRVRLRANFDISKFANPVTRLLLRQLKEYGLILADAGYPWQVQTDFTPVPPQVAAAFEDIHRSVQPSDMEVVDESSLEVSPRSGETDVDAETVIATDARNSDISARIRVVLNGITLGVASTQEVIQAGASGKRLVAWVHGTSDTSTKWTLSAPVGALSEDGVYTPPSKMANPVTVTARVSSEADPAVFANIRITILPAGTIRIAVGRNTPYIDSHGNTWLAGVGYDGGWNYDNGGVWPNIADVDLYRQIHYGFGDMTFQLHVPNGQYRLIAKFVEAEYGKGRKIFHLETQGKIIYRDVDVYELAGGDRRPLDLELPATVTDETLTFVIRHVSGEHVDISALTIERDPDAPHLTISPLTATVHAANRRQFYAVGWFTDNSVTWSVSPKIGSVDANGLYAAPSDAPARDTQVTITATSTVNPAISANATLTVLSGIPPIRINAGGQGFTDSDGQVWSADFGFLGATVSYDGFGTKILNADGQEFLYQSSRYNYQGQGSFSYSLPTANGEYRVRLKWAEYRDVPQKAKMDVAINGRVVLQNFDPTVAAGGVRIAYDQVFTASVTHGLLVIQFTAKPSIYVGAWISGIEVEPTSLVPHPQN
jgi:hypothetical protein